MDATTLLMLVSSVPVVGHYAVWLIVAVVVCSILDAAIPQPVAGSIWVRPRKIVSAIAMSVLHARNAIPAGSQAAAVVVAVEAVEAVIVPPAAPVVAAGTAP